MLTRRRLLLDQDIERIEKWCLLNQSAFVFAKFNQSVSSHAHHVSAQLKGTYLEVSALKSALKRGSTGAFILVIIIILTFLALFIAMVKERRQRVWHATNRYELESNPGCSDRKYNLDKLGIYSTRWDIEKPQGWFWGWNPHKGLDLPFQQWPTAF